MPDFRVALTLSEDEALALVNVLEPRLLDLANGLGEIFDGETDAIRSIARRLRARLEHAPKQPIDYQAARARLRAASTRLR